MVVEIERKFLINNPNHDHWEIEKFKKKAKKFEIAQGYLQSTSNYVVRVRKENKKYVLCIKTNIDHLSKREIEKKLSPKEGEFLLGLCYNVIEKTRYKAGRWEVDIFKGKNEPLILAEIELKSKDENFSFLNFTLIEVTGDSRYYNSFLAKNPYSSWRNTQP